MDAATHPHGVLEEVEAGPYKVLEPAGAGSEREKYWNTSQFEKRLLANCQQPYTQSGPVQRETQQGGLSHVLNYYKSVAA
jgi:hypothetical protein